MDGEIILREPEGGDLSWLSYRHMRTVAVEHGWNRRYEGHLAEIVGKALLHFDPARERFWVAARGEEVLGCVGCQRETDEVARLRMMFVEPAARGQGLGDRLVEACIAFAREAGYREMTLWTLDVLTAARRLYARHGFVMQSAEPWDDIGPVMMDETWSRKL